MSFAKKGPLAIAAAAGLGGFESVIALQKQMEMLRTQTGASRSEVDRMTKGVIRMAASVGTSPQQLALGLYHVESAGLRGAKALSALRVAAEGAKIGGANLEDVTNGPNAAIVSGIGGRRTTPRRWAS